MLQVKVFYFEKLTLRSVSESIIQPERYAKDFCIFDIYYINLIQTHHQHQFC